MSLSETQIQECAALMARRFIDDPGIAAQMQGLEDPLKVLELQCLGQIRAYDEADLLALYEHGPSFMVGFRTDQVTEEGYLAIVQNASLELLQALSENDLLSLQQSVLPVAEISDEYWYRRYYPEQTVYVLQVICIDESLKGTGAFRKMIEPVINDCKEMNIPVVLQTHNPGNVPLYEHFGFQLIERVDSETVDLSCFNMARV
ncbi:MAG: hypothetical protein ACI4B9_04055 [Eggerthellaceae bacterium]